MKVCCLISQIDSVRKTPLPELSDTIHLLDDIPQRWERGLLSVCSFAVFKIYSGENDLNMTGISMQILFGKSHQCYCVNSPDETLQLTKSRHNLLRIFMLLKFLNLGSGFPVKNRLKPFFPFIVRQPENTRHQPALRAIISFNLLLTAERMGNILCDQPRRLISHCYAGFIYRLFIGLWEIVRRRMNVLWTLKTNRISCPRLRLTVKGWYSLYNGWLSSPASGVVPLAASDIARRHQGWRCSGSQVSLYISVSTHTLPV